MNDWQLSIYLALMFLMWYVVLFLWEKAGFKGSFEWFTALTLSGKMTSGNWLKLQSILYEPEKMVEHVAERRTILKKEKGLIITNLVFAGFYALLIILLMLEVVSL